MATGKLDGSQADRMSRPCFFQKERQEGIDVFMDLEMADLRAILRRHLRMILLLVILSVAAAGGISFFVLSPIYEAKSSLIVKKQNLGGQIGYDDLITSEKLVKTYTEIIKSRLVLEGVIARLQLALTAEQLLQNLQVKADNESLITTIVVRDENPAQAVTLANELARTSMQTWNSIMQMENVSLIDEARLQSNPKPVLPRPYLNMGLTLVLALLAGVGLAILREYLDKTLKTEEELEEMLKLPVLGVIPVMKKAAAN